MNSTLRNVIFTIIGIIIFFVISWFFITLIPYLLIGGLIIFIIAKIRKSFKGKSSKEDNYDINDRVKYNSSPAEQYYDDNNEKVIDVEYKEVNND